MGAEAPRHDFDEERALLWNHAIEMGDFNLARTLQPVNRAPEQSDHDLREGTTAPAATGMVSEAFGDGHLLPTGIISDGFGDGPSGRH